MTETALDVYVDAFARRVRTMRPNDGMIDSLGLVGVRRDERLSVLVTDDRAVERLGLLLDEAQSGVVRVLSVAARSAELLCARRRWSAKPVTAMVCRDLARVPSMRLPADLTVADVAIDSAAELSGVDLIAAAAVAVQADPAAADVTSHQMAADLRAMRPAPCLLAAVDGSDVVRATAGFRVSCLDASVFFVNTQRDWQRRGIGRAMTAAALHRARRAGAVQACLDASEAGVSIYRGLGFETAGPVTQFVAH